MSTKQRQIKVGPDFFAKSKNDYSDWRWALIREFMQNSIDCGSKNIEITITHLRGETSVIVQNDGEPMTEDILTNKLLSLGSSGKNFNGSVGGFGKAKEILYFCHDRYSIETGSLIVEGSGAEYTLKKAKGSRKGTISTIVVSGDVSDELLAGCERFARLAQWSGSFTVNGKRLDCSMRKGSYRREIGCGKIYTNRSLHSRLVVRIGGIPMFTQYISFDGCVLLELDGSSLDCLTSNRDGMRHGKADDLNHFLQALAADKRSALRASNPSYVKYDGERIGRARNEASETLGSIINSAAPAEGATFGSLTVAAKSASSKQVVVKSREQRSKCQLNHEFIIKNETDMVIPSYYLPEGEMGSYAQKLIGIWARVLLKMHEVLGINDDFSIGFVFSADAEAQHETSGTYGRVYYINPARVVEQSSSKSHSFKKAFKLNERDRIIAIALHEIVHGRGYDVHDEGYANRLTDMMVPVMANRKKFAPCFS